MWLDRLTRALPKPRRVREALRGARTDVPLPLDMFDAIRSDAETKSAEKLAGIYHRGQERIWDGRELLAELVARHGHPKLDDRVRPALQRVFAVILWGELAAWKISAELALQLEPLEAKMAATSQTHDEARHFYVMHDYLALLGTVPRQLGPASTRVLLGTLKADTLAKKLMGMQMMIEPMALTIFQAVRENRAEPVLADLLRYYERDEARHVALGVLHLPKLLTGLTLPEAVDLWAWQFQEFWCQFRALRELEDAFEALGVDPMHVMELGRGKQIRAQNMLMEEIGYETPVSQVFLRFFDGKAAWEFPKDCSRSDYGARIAGAVRAALRGERVVPDVLHEVEVAPA